ncbi:MAG: PD40 domain-containing protein [Nitrospirae bacterium]|nr:PD40 domain-containing protein [Nitrospirota bacterium]
MKNNFKFQISNFKVIIFFCSLFTLHCSLFTPAHAKVYIDIASPGTRQLPLSIRTSGAPESKEIESIIKNDLEFTGLFNLADPGVPGVEIAVNMEVDNSDGLKVMLSVIDLIENKEVLKKKLSATRIRSMAHSISNDIYYIATGKKGIFRTKLSYLVNTTAGNKELRLMDWDGAEAIRLISKGLTSSHSWSQDGRFLLYSSERDRMWKIYMLNFVDYREMVLFSSQGLNLVGGASPDDKISFSSSKDGGSEIYIIDIYGKDFKKLTRAFGIDVSPAFSPDGSHIAFVSDRGGSPQIYIMDSDGGGMRRLTFEGSYNTSPSWSPDGKWIAYTGRRDGKNQIFMVKSDSSDIRQLTFSGNNENPSFSPDGLFLAFDSDRDGKKGVYLMRLHAEGHKRITPKDINATSPKWSPYFK